MFSHDLRCKCLLLIQFYTSKSVENSNFWRILFLDCCFISQFLSFSDKAQLWITRMPHLLTQWTTIPKNDWQGDSSKLLTRHLELNCKTFGHFIVLTTWCADMNSQKSGETTQHTLTWEWTGWIMYANVQNNETKSEFKSMILLTDQELVRMQSKGGNATRIREGKTNAFEGKQLTVNISRILTL